MADPSSSNIYVDVSTPSGDAAEIIDEEVVETPALADERMEDADVANGDGAAAAGTADGEEDGVAEKVPPSAMSFLEYVINQKIEASSLYRIVTPFW